MGGIILVSEMGSCWNTKRECSAFEIAQCMSWEIVCFGHGLGLETRRKIFQNLDISRL